MTAFTSAGIELREAPTAGAISTDELRERLDESAVAIVDVRPVAAYNGWRLRGEARGGHIPGAVSFPAAWISTVDHPEIERLLRSKEIGPHRSVVLYGDGGVADVTGLAGWLESSGHPDVRIYADGWPGWAADRGAPDREAATPRQAGAHRLAAPGPRG
jgi:thiosulfate/3-mercaptopyruvate sulfurtransferase